MLYRGESKPRFEGNELLRRKDLCNFLEIRTRSCEAITIRKLKINFKLHAEETDEVK
jgi:hypothetical protein